MIAARSQESNPDVSREHKSGEKKSRFLIFITSDKGGCGKSTFARGLTEYFTQTGVIFSAFDTDTQNPQLHRHYKSAMDIQRINIRKEGGFDSILNHMANQKTDYLLVDLAAGSNKIIKEIDDSVGLFESCSELGYQIVFITVLSRVKDSVAALVDLKNVSSENATHIVVKNLYFGDSEEFLTFDNSATKKGLNPQKSSIIHMPKLADTTYESVDRDSLPFGTAMKPDGGLSFSERRRVTRWMQNFGHEFQPALRLLGL